MTLAVAVVGSLACGHRSASSGDFSPVRGAVYRLRAVDGARLPTRFSPLDDPRLAPAARIDSGRIAFHDDGRATGIWHGTGEMAGVSNLFQARYVEDGARVLLYAGEGAPPDTAVVVGDTMTVRARFVHPLSRQGYVVVMTYTR